MTNIYIEGNIPEDCLNCPCMDGEFSRCNLIHCDHSIGYYNEDEIEFKYVPINQDFEELICPLKKLSEHTEQVKKDTCNQIYQIFTDKSMWETMKDWWLNNGDCRELKALLSAVAEGKPTKEIIKKFSKDSRMWALLDRIMEEK